jgi:hypothetical protein
MSKTKMIARAIAASILLASAAGTSANATELQFTWNFAGAGSPEIFDLDTASIAPDAFGTDYIQAVITNDNEGQTAAFFGDAAQGGLFGTGVLRTAAPFGVQPAAEDFIITGDFFTGSNTAPTLGFQAGTVYTLIDGHTLSVAAIPEPSAWALMLVGFGALGGVVRHRRRAAIQAV